jgi:outer membrane protein OmpA-like peptidoglycan-associated protein
MSMSHRRFSIIAALALGGTLLAACASAPPPPPAAAPPPPAAPPPAPPPPPAAPALALVGAQLDIKGEIEFDTGKATIKDNAASQGVLNAALAILKGAPMVTKVRVEGHTDSDGIPAENQKLSEARAAAVVKWLVDHGIEANRFVTAGCAARDPLFKNDTPEHKARNRRTEFDLEELNGKRPEGYTEACAPNTARK